MKKIKTIGIIANSTKENAAEYAMKFCRWLDEKGICYYLESEIAVATSQGEGLSREELALCCDMIVVFGGDGTLLMAARQAAERDVPIVGINLGGFGFMTVVNLNEMSDVMERILEGKYSVSKRMMLEAAMGEHSYRALNDIVINRGSRSRMISMETFVDGKYLTTYRADGIIFSTPTGSTAYTLSTGGPIVIPELYSIIITPICPHTLTNRPIMLPCEAEIRVKLLQESDEATITVDGQVLRTFQSGEETIIRKSEHYVTLVNSPFHDYFEILRTKLGWGGMRRTC